jgi:hypothetical protein
MAEAGLQWPHCKTLSIVGLFAEGFYGGSLHDEHVSSGPF